MEKEEHNEYIDAAISTAELVAKKQKAYGDSFGKASKILEVLYPNGIGVEQYGDMLTVVRVIDKLFRVATQKDAFGENPWKDINGYSLLECVKEKRSLESQAQ